METGTLAPLDIKCTEIECGDCFCEMCGDCIYCYGEDPCYGDVAEDGTPTSHWYTWPKEEEC